MNPSSIGAIAKMVSIRPWTQADIDYVTQSVQGEGWGYTRRDIERCWQFEPNGCFLAEVQNKPVGHVFTISYGNTGWIGLLIVNLEKRDKGIGTILMQTAIKYLQKAGAETIRLEAVEKAVPLYRRLGFSEEFDSLRFSKQLKQKEKPKHTGEKMFKMRKEDIDDIAKFDSEHFGANRLHVLQSLYQDQPKHCFVAEERRRVLGYLMSRKIQNAHWIGPWVCENSETAEKLLKTCIDAITEDTELRLGMSVLNTNGTRLMKNIDFQLKSKSIHMAFGKHKHQGDTMGIYGIGGPEKG